MYDIYIRSQKLGFYAQIACTRIMVFKGMVFKSKYWVWEKNKGFFLSEYLNFGELKSSHKGIQSWFSFKL